MVLVVLVDNSGGHGAGDLKVPANVRLFRLPACTPELQPAEHLWPLVREALATRASPARSCSPSRTGWDAS